MSLIIIKNLDYADNQIKLFINKLLNTKSFIDSKSKTIYLSNTIFLIEETFNQNISKIGLIRQNNNKPSEIPLNLTSYLKLLQKHQIKVKNLEQFIKDNKESIDFVNNTIDLFYKLILNGKGEYLLLNNYEYQKHI